MFAESSQVSVGRKVKRGIEQKQVGVAGQTMNPKEK